MKKKVIRTLVCGSPNLSLVTAKERGGLCNHVWVETCDLGSRFCFDSPYVLEMKERNLVCRAK